jgi:MraZ protein
MTDLAQRFFTGTFTHMIDNQNRVTIPAIWRVLKENVFIVPHPDKVLWVLPEVEMAKIHEKLSSASIADREKWNFVRVFSGQTQQCVLDSQGRITISDELLKYAELERNKDAVLVGLVKQFEIVKPDRWNDLVQRVQADYGEIAARVGL